MTAVDTLRNALYGNPPVASWQPSREGVMSAFQEMYSQVTNLVSGIVSYTTVASLPSATTTPIGSQARVFADATPTNNTYWVRQALTGTNNGWVIDTNLINSVAIIVQPLVDSATGSASASATSAAAALAVNAGLFPVTLVENTANDEHRIYRSVNYVVGRVYRGWAVVKPNGRLKFNIYLQDTGLAFNGTFDISGGTSSGTGASMIYRGNGEWLCQVTATATGTGTANFQAVRILSPGGTAPYIGDGASGVHVLAAGFDENGVTLYPTDTTALLSSDWTKQSLTAFLSTTVRFSGTAQLVDYLLRNVASGVATGAYTGKKWTALGDSQTARGYYTGSLQSLSGMVLTNLGISGKTIGVNNTDGTAAIRDSASTIPVDAQIVTLHAGINDFALNTPLGALGDLTKATFYGAIYEIAYAIFARVPNAVMFFASPCPGGGTGTYGTDHGPKMANALGFHVRDYQKAMRDVCDWIGVPFTDVGTQANINDFTGDRLLSDGLHYNAIGGNVIAAYWYDDMTKKAKRGVLM